MNVSEQIQQVKLAKADKLFWEDVKSYGGERQALRALDCVSRQEAIQMLAVVQPVTVRKHEGQLTID